MRTWMLLVGFYLAIQLPLGILVLSGGTASARNSGSRLWRWVIACQIRTRSGTRLNQ